MIVLGLALALSVALSSGARAEKYSIDREVWAHYQSYLKTIGKIRPGAYAITIDGHGAFYVYCQETRCMAGPGYGQEARNRCEREYGTECVVFAVRDDIKVEYEIVDDMSTAGAPSVPLVMPATPATRIAVTSAVQADIDAYLLNAHAPGRAWALAIAKDGSKVKSASCAAGGSYSDGSACDPTHGSAQELARGRAIKECGGPGNCVLLYLGDKKAADIEVVAQ
jgi:hypothetical protein